MANKYGFDKISKITPETFKDVVSTYIDENGELQVIEETVLEVVWIEAEGTLYSVETEKGETLEGLASRYRVGGYTDGRCCFVQSIS